MAPQQWDEDYRNHLRDAQRTEAWKYVGYPGFSRFMASSIDCFAVRKFCHLNVRVLLKLQNDIVELERKLMAMDLHSMNTANGKGGCGSFRLDTGTPREELLDCIAEKVKDYNERLNQFLQLQDRPTSSHEQISNLRTWLLNYPNAIEEKEQEFLRREEDLAVVRTAQRTAFGKWMESIGLTRIARPFGLSSSGPTKYYDRAIWKSIGAIVILAIMLMMLLGPLWSLPFAVGSATRLAVVTAFTIAFTLLVVTGTTLGGFKRLILIAGYFTQLILVLGLAPGWKSNAATAVPVASSSASSTTAIAANTTASVTMSTTLSTVSTTSVSGTATPSSFAAQEMHPPFNAGAIAGITVGVALGFLMAFLMILWVCHRRRCCRAHTEEDVTAHLEELGKKPSMEKSKVLRTSTTSSRRPAKVREKWIGVGFTRQEAMDSQILEMPERTRCLELEDQLSLVRQSWNVLPASLERRATTPSRDEIALDHHNEEIQEISPSRDAEQGDQQQCLVGISTDHAQGDDGKSPGETYQRTRPLAQRLQIRTS